MKKLVVCAVFLGALSGCATQSEATQAMYMQEATIANNCLGSVGKLSLEARFAIDVSTGVAPITSSVQCYTSGITAAAQMMRYPHTDIVISYSNYLIGIVNARNGRQIDEKSAVAATAQANELFRKSILSADGELARQARKDFARKLAALSTVMAEQDRQRANAAAANQSVVCTAHGVYTQNTVICR